MSARVEQVISPRVAGKRSALSRLASRLTAEAARHDLNADALPRGVDQDLEMVRASVKREIVASITGGTA